MSPGVSACVIAGEDASTIRRCLASLVWTDERVVVIDERSRDETESICHELGARVLRHPYRGNVEQKNHALAQATADWVLCLDADEVLTEALCESVRDFLAGSPDCDGAELNRVTHHLGRWIRHGDFHPDWQLRLFRREHARWEGANPHGRVRVPGRVRRLQGDLEHYSYTDLADQIQRVQRYSDVEAREMLASGRRVRLRDLLLRPPARFARAYLLKAGFLDGVPGFAIAAVTAFHVFLKYAKLWELERRCGSST